ncbi:MAG TPA: amino acid adenylation domain-containing protein, partial [Thermoanaerobaculia bacterium]|nr:amino acid adenylation domain-containing protein [Thermoanaerobaculia bacterium]
MSPPELSEAKRRVLESCLRGERLPAEPPRPVAARAGGPVPATAGQREIWMHEQLAGRPIYNESATIRRRGDLDEDALDRALSEIVRRHESWRTRFTVAGGRLVQQVEPAFRIPVAREDLRALLPEARERRAAELAAADAALPFDLSRPPLFRARLIRFADDDHRLFLTIHHLIFDTASLFGTFFPELVGIYEAFRAGRPSPLPPPPVQFADYAAWEADRILPPEAVEFWRERLADLPAPTALPSDRERPGEIAGVGAVRRVEFPAEVRDGAAGLAEECGATPFVVLFASLAAALSRFTGDDDLVLGCVSAARPRTEFEDVLGYFLNPVLLRTSVAGDPSFRDLVSRARESVVSALAHAEVPYERLAAEVPGRGGAPLFRILLSYEPPRAPVPPGWDLTLFEASSGSAKFDVSLEMESRPEGIVGRFLYDADLYDAESIRVFEAHWRALLGSALADPDRRISELALAGETPADIGAPAGTSMRPAPVEFDRRASELASAPALRFHGRTTTYGELAGRVTRIAAALQNRGIGRESIVALAMPRSDDRVAAILAIGRAGAAWLPLGSDWPPARVAAVLERSRPALVISSGRPAAFGGVPSVPLVDLETEPGWTLDGIPELSDLAYVLYTSGSTGEPKGVAIEHRPLANLLAWSQRAFPLGRGDRVLQKAPLGFDASVWEIYAPLVAGATLVVAPPGAGADPRLVAALLREERITHLKLVPSLLRILVTLPDFAEAPALRHVFCGGEAIPADLVREFFRVSRAELHNLYGPTETCVDVASYRCRPQDAGRRVPIGTAIDGARLDVLDRRGRRTPAGAPGELYVGGVPLARGYLGREDLTRDRFVPDPFGAPGDRLYRTGDRVRRRADGEIEFLGRVDDQRKVRGVRVEPAEIEAALRRCPGVEDAAVAVRGEGLAATLAAYVAAPAAASEAAARRELARALRERVASILPRAFVPEAITVLASLPLTASGKVDRRALPEPERFFESAAAPGSREERLLVEIWREV